MDYYIGVDFFELKFLMSAQPKNSSNVCLRQGLSEILEAYANSLCRKVGEQKGVSMIKDLISDDIIEVFRLMLEDCKFDRGLSTMKHLKQTNSGKKFALMNAEDGQKWLDKNKNAAIESEESIIDNNGSNVISDHCIEFVEIIREEIDINSDSSSSGEFESVIHERVSSQI